MYAYMISIQFPDFFYQVHILPPGTYELYIKTEVNAPVDKTLINKNIYLCKWLDI